MHSYHRASLALIAAITLTACGSKTDASEKNFAKALNQYFDKHGEVCLGLRSTTWPAKVESNPFSANKKKQMDALHTAGLVSRQEAEEPIIGWNKEPTGRTKKVTTYTLTDAGQSFLVEKTRTILGTYTDICWGKKAVKRVVKWDAPMQMGDYKATKVTYTYTLRDVADWARQPEMQAAFPSIKTTLEAAEKKEDKHGVHLTSEGWEANGLD